MILVSKRGRIVEHGSFAGLLAGQGVLRTGRGPAEPCRQRFVARLLNRVSERRGTDPFISSRSRITSPHYKAG